MTSRLSLDSAKGLRQNKRFALLSGKSDDQGSPCFVGASAPSKALIPQALDDQLALAPSSKETGGQLA